MIAPLLVRTALIVSPHDSRQTVERVSSSSIARFAEETLRAYEGAPCV